MDQVLKAREELWTSVDGVPDEVVRRANSGNWSIMDVLEHLQLVDQLVLRVIKDALSKPPVTDQIQANPMETALDRTNKLNAPESLTPKGVLRNLDDAHQQLAVSREQLLSFVSLIDTDVLRSHGATHPRFGMLSAEQWLQFVGLHERRHIAQIEEMKDEFNRDE